MTEIAQCNLSTWSETLTEEVFGNDKYFSKTHLHKHAINEEMYRWRDKENDWSREGQIGLPGYFKHFDVKNAQIYYEQLRKKVAAEAAKTDHRQLTTLEEKANRLLFELATGFSPNLMAFFRNGTTKYSVGETEYIIGELKNSRGFKQREVYFHKDLLVSCIAEAFAVWIHEHAHIFGYDGSRQFTDALTEIIENIVCNRKMFDDYENQWNRLVEKINK